MIGAMVFLESTLFKKTLSDAVHVLLFWHLQQNVFVILSCTVTRDCFSFQAACDSQVWDTRWYPPPLNLAWLSVYLCVARRDNDKCFPSFFGARAVAVALQTNHPPSSEEWVPIDRRTSCLIGPVCTLLTLKNSNGVRGVLSESYQLCKVTHKIFLYI